MLETLLSRIKAQYEPADLSCQEEYWEEFEVDGTLYDINTYDCNVFGGTKGYKRIAVYGTKPDIFNPGFMTTDFNNSIGSWAVINEDN